jgi:hypothetical protein
VFDCSCPDKRKETSQEENAEVPKGKVCFFIGIEVFAADKSYIAIFWALVQ